MLKRGLIFIGVISLAIAVFAEGEQLILYFFVLFPLLLFPIFYYMDRRDFFFFASISVTVFVFVLYAVRYRLIEMAGFGFCLASLFAAVLYYRNRWSREYQLEASHLDNLVRELETLRNKHHSRLESLHHLEKQVAGLLDLFEIARDFSECLSFDGLADILYKKVMPELPFDRLRLLFVEKAGEGSVCRAFSVSAEGVQSSSEELAPHELRELEKLKQSRQMIRKGGLWFFPLLSEQDPAATRMMAALHIEGAQDNDLAKFEVLGAYLNLQVKKIRLYERVKEMAIKDGLTGAFVRRHFLERFEEEFKRAMKYHLPLAVLMLDIDHFKRYNDDHGHLAGDAALKDVAALLTQNLRKVDIVARYGGEEFVVVIPETRTEGAYEVAERIRSSIARHNFKVFQEDTKVTVSLGITVFPDDLSDFKRESSPSELTLELIRRADQALYRAKEEGRNRVVLFKDL